MNTLDWIGSIFLTNDMVSMNITPLVIRVEITEDLFSPYPMGYLILEEMPSNNLIGKMGADGLVGKGEEIRLAFTGKIGEYYQELQGFFCYKVEPFVSDDPLTLKSKMNYKLYFSSQIFFINELIRVDRYYEDKLSEIVKQLVEKQLQGKLTTIEETSKKQSIFFPQLTPIECINMCASRSISKENENDANYVFYGDIDHKYHFVSLGKLMSSKPVIGTYDYDGIKIETTFGTNYLSSGDINKGTTKYNAIRYSVKPISPIKQLINGMFSSSLLEFDITKKKYKTYKYDYSKEFKKSRHLVDKPIISKSTDFISLSYLNPDAFPVYHTSAHYIIDENETAEFSNNSTNSGRDYILKRRSQLQQINQMGLEIELPGNPILKIGQTVFFGRPQIDFSGADANTALRNPFVTGKFLITRKTSILENSTANNTLGFNLKTVFSLRKDSDIGTANKETEGTTV
jgi:hypothetical protein